MSAVLAVLTLIAFVWLIVVNLRISRSLQEFLPPQFQDELSSRYAFAVWALRYPTPLSLQAEYVRLVKGSCVAVLCGALTLLSSGQIVFGCLGLVAFAVSAFSAVRASKTFEQNRRRALTEGDEQTQ